MDYSFYCVDIESSGLCYVTQDVIEISIIRLKDNDQKTWCLKPLNFDTIDIGALKKNGHKLEDLKGETKFGRDTYLNPAKVIVDIENWLMEDGVPTENRCLIGHNVSFDKVFLEQLWRKCNSFDSFPFGRRYMDTMIIELFLDHCSDKLAEGYSLANLTKKYGVKNDKAHSAAADTKATKEVFIKQSEFFRKLLNV